MPEAQARARKANRQRAWLRALLFALFALPAYAEQPPAQKAARSTAARDIVRLGTLEFQACEIGTRRASGVPTQAAFCARFDVPENWEDPAGRHIGLRVALVRSSAPEADRDLVVFLDGGPGGAATEDYSTIAGALAPLRRHHDILLMDQRGTGGSNPLSCGDELVLDVDKPAPRPRGAAPVADAQLRTAAGRAEQLDKIRRCLAALAPAADPRYYATGDAIRDLAALRHALGDPLLDLVGVSYGTRVAQQYAAHYPQSVRSIVLDSAVPNRLVLLADFAANLEDALRRRLALCTADPACNRRFGDPYHSLQLVLARLRQQPQSVEIRDPQTFALARETLTADDMAALVRFYMYGASTSALLPYLIDEARAERYAPLLSQARLTVGDVFDKLNGGMSASVLCTEDADLLHEQPEDEDTVLGGSLVRAAKLACEAWPHRSAPADFHQPFGGAIPVLLLAGEFDPVTPPRYGTEIASGLEHARLLLAPGQGHAVIGAGCMPKLVAEFVRSLDPARLDAHCLQVLGNAPPFIDANGAAP
jgi:pimeloyl-ACP methyl ester carboxylesterase